jgi:hypothetical protein
MPAIEICVYYCIVQSLSDVQSSSGATALSVSISDGLNGNIFKLTALLACLARGISHLELRHNGPESQVVVRDQTPTYQFMPSTPHHRT